MPKVQRLKSGSVVKITDPSGNVYDIVVRNRSVSGGVEIALNFPRDWKYDFSPPKNQPTPKRRRLP
jgi:hypothetical protein